MSTNLNLKLSEYSTLLDKSVRFFQGKRYLYNCINNLDEFEDWFGYWEKFNKNRKYKVYFRGMGEAKYKLFSSAQRLWLNHKMQAGVDQAQQQQYQDFVLKLISESLGNGSVLDKVFDLYGIKDSHKEFPCLSILQHYGSPTPLLDWTYNFRVALFFATEYTTFIEPNATNDLENYFSIYAITEETFRVTEIEDREDVASCFPLAGEYPHPHPGHLLRLTDVKLDLNGDCDPTDPFKKVLMATIYNQNIIPQEGLFIFNPYEEIPLEDLFNNEYRGEIELDETNVPHSSFIVYNIHKSLVEHVKQKIAKEGYTRDYIMPDLNTFAGQIKQQVLKSLV